MPWSLFPKTSGLSIEGRSPGTIPVFVQFLLLWATFSEVKGCWGSTSPNYGETTHDYSLLSGSTLVLNCTLNGNYISVDNHGNRKFYVNSSYISFRKKNRNSSEDVLEILNERTAQLKIPNSTVGDTGMYHCDIAIPELSGEKRLVCSSKVTVGYPPKPVSNFHCISMHFENLTCYWDVVENPIQTEYNLSKHFELSSFYSSPPMQLCPLKSFKNNTHSCMWSDSTSPPYNRLEQVITFVVTGNNTFGTANQSFTLNHYEFVVPSWPQSLKMVQVTQRNLTVGWSSPKKMKGMKDRLPLLYQLRVEEAVGNSPERKVFDAGVNTNRFTVTHLIPYMKYRVLLRCRSNFTVREDMWGPSSALAVETLPDAPYEIPEIINEAYELHHFDGYRTATLYWKPVPTKHYNGESFAYSVVLSEGDCDDPVKPLIFEVKTLSKTFDYLLENTSYCFQLYSINQMGVSANHRVVQVAQQKIIPPVPEDITAISHDKGHYVITWKPPKPKADIVVTSYMVLWCSSLKPWLARCEGPIQWLEQPLLGWHNITLNLSDVNTNFQFAVVANTAEASSGMRWATCIVPYSAALGKIESVFVEGKNSTSLKVIWKLHCPAQRAVVKKFEIVYCKVNSTKHCQERWVSVDITNSSTESFELQGLHPYSDYKVVIRAYNLKGISSENSDPKFQSTSEGAPSDPPRSVVVEVSENDTISISWLPPTMPNGVLSHYNIYVNGSLKKIPADGENRHQLNASELKHYANYTIRMAACVAEEFCSPQSSPVVVQTNIGVPGHMTPPRIETVNSTMINVSWNAPAEPNGPIDFYEIQWGLLNEENSSSEAEVKTKYVIGSTSTLVELNCKEFEGGDVVHAFSVRAANVKDGKLLQGPLSDSTKVGGCFLTEGTAMIVGIAIGGTLALGFAALLIYKLIDWMRDKIHQVKNITIQLPKGLDGPEANPLNNYEQFKNGLLHQNSANKGVERLSYIIEDGDNKNRHGSGSSQYSNSSTDELLIKNGKCTKFGRKASGESSGCSSMSSNTTRSHLSSDSGTESDFHIPPSLDAVFVEANGHKPSPLPIVMENQDPSRQSESQPADLAPQATKPPSKPTGSLQEGVVLKIDQPYSKFGIAGVKGHSANSWWMNPLAFYSYHLANSEPSVVDFDQAAGKRFPQVCPPYSKIGLARSSGDILRMANENPGSGYSKFGIMRHPESARNDPPCYDPEMTSPTVGVVMLNSNPLAMDCHALAKVPPVFRPDSKTLSPYISFKQFSQKNEDVSAAVLEEEGAYTKFGMRDRFPVISPADYVTLSDIQVLHKDIAPCQTSCTRGSPASELQTSSRTSSGIESMCDDAINGAIDGGNLTYLGDPGLRDPHSSPTDRLGEEESTLATSDGELQSPPDGTLPDGEQLTGSRVIPSPSVSSDDFKPDRGITCQEGAKSLPSPNHFTEKSSNSSGGAESPAELEHRPSGNRLEPPSTVSCRGASTHSKLSTSDDDQHSSRSTSRGQQSAISETPAITTPPPGMPTHRVSDTLRGGVLQRDCTKVQINEGPADGCGRKNTDLRTHPPSVKNGYVAFTSLLPSAAETVTGHKSRKSEDPAQQTNRGSIPVNSHPLKVPDESSVTNGCVNEPFKGPQDALPLRVGVISSEATDFQHDIPSRSENNSTDHFIHLMPTVESEICEV